MTNKYCRTPKRRDGVPLEYWETYDARQGGRVGHFSENGLFIRFPVSMHIGVELRIRIFFSFGYEFDEIQVLARIMGKDLCCEGGWEVYEYELEIMRISKEDRLKLGNLLRIRQARMSALDTPCFRKG
jgi:hypothetical protein